LLWTGLYSGKFEFSYPVNVGDWAIVVDAFVRTTHCHKFIFNANKKYFVVRV